LLKRIFIILEFEILRPQNQNNASMRCFVFPDFTYAVVKVLPDFKLIAQFEPSILSTKFKAFTFKLGMTGSWGHPADTSKSHITIEWLSIFQCKTGD
jgi:hypothetical protein